MNFLFVNVSKPFSSYIITEGKNEPFWVLFYALAQDPCSVISPTKFFLFEVMNEITMVRNCTISRT